MLNTLRILSLIVLSSLLNAPGYAAALAGNSTEKSKATDSPYVVKKIEVIEKNRFPSLEPNGDRYKLKFEIVTRCERAEPTNAIIVLKLLDEDQNLVKSRRISQRYIGTGPHTRNVRLDLTNSEWESFSFYTAEIEPSTKKSTILTAENFGYKLIASELGEEHYEYGKVAIAIEANFYNRFERPKKLFIRLYLLDENGRCLYPAHKICGDPAIKGGKDGLCQSDIIYLDEDKWGKATSMIVEADTGSLSNEELEKKNLFLPESLAEKEERERAKEKASAKREAKIRAEHLMKECKESAPQLEQFKQLAKELEKANEEVSTALEELRQNHPSSRTTPSKSAKRNKKRNPGPTAPTPPNKRDYRRETIESIYPVVMTSTVFDEKAYKKAQRKYKQDQKKHQKKRGKWLATGEELQHDPTAKNTGKRSSTPGYLSLDRSLRKKQKSLEIELRDSVWEYCRNYVHKQLKEEKNSKADNTATD